MFAEDFHSFWMPGIGQVGIEFSAMLIRATTNKMKPKFVRTDL